MSNCFRRKAWLLAFLNRLILLFLFFEVFCFETESPYVVQVGLTLPAILLPQLSDAEITDVSHHSLLGYDSSSVVSLASTNLDSYILQVFHSARFYKTLPLQFHGPL